MGYGHLIKPGEHFTTITREQAEELLQKELRELETLKVLPEEIEIKIPFPVYD
ncbi:hypothetical protein [Liberibacter crescens]|uniref:hypothetical protein n=1 Tax=Liberibacter crescens TaxID=1273132 RepID=UPI003CC71749